MQTKHHLKILFVAFAVLAIIGAGYFFRMNLNDWYQIAQNEIKTGIVQLGDFEREVITPAPLRGPTEEVISELSVTGIISQTNLQRAQNNLPPLSIDQQLTAMAEAKVDDMFVRQYFAHESPTGESPGDLAEAVGYKYAMVGENLALGNYKDDEVLVEAWMNSPGHRDNILHPKYSEIGVAIKRGVYEGHTVWMAVQEFGHPTADCPLPDETLSAQIEKNKVMLAELERQLEEKSNEIKSFIPPRGPVYNQKIREYNDLVRRYNELFEIIKILISNYNNQVEEYNACINEF